MKKSDFDIDPYEPCPCGSGKKYKFCCVAKTKDNRHGKWPIGTVALYGPDDKTTTKIAAAINRSEYDNDPPVMRWVASDVTTSPKVLTEIRQFFAKHGVKNVVLTDGNLGCPHEEGIDFKDGEDCPFCPFWAGKQGTARRDDIDEEGDIDDDEAADAFSPMQIPSQPAAFDKREKTPEELAQEARINAILPDPNLSFHRAIETMLAHLSQRLQLPCAVRCDEPFHWEVGLEWGEMSKEEHARLRIDQPSFQDEFELESLTLEVGSPWMNYRQDIGASVKRVSDGKTFVVALTQLNAVEKESSNHELLDDYFEWFDGCFI